jgi:hypothetical protein
MPRLWICIKICTKYATHRVVDSPCLSLLRNVRIMNTGARRKAKHKKKKMDESGQWIPQAGYEDI